MADIGRSSFIPKETAGLTPNRIRRKRTFHIFGFIATTMLIGSLLLALGVYFLKSTAENGLLAAQQALGEQKNLFMVEHIVEVREFDRRLKAAEALLQNHIAPLKIFAALERETKQQIQFTSFTLEHTPSREILVTLEGTTPAFKSLALQELQFGENQLLNNIAFNKVSINEETEGTIVRRMVVFSLNGTVDVGSVRYDGASVFTEAPARFTESNDVLSLEETEPVVLGEAITEEEL